MGIGRPTIDQFNDFEASCQSTENHQPHKNSELE